MTTAMKSALLLLPALLLLGVLVTPNAAGAQVKPTVTIKKVGQEYRVQGSVRIPAAEGALWAALTDYDRLSSFVEPLTSRKKPSDEGSWASSSPSSFSTRNSKTEVDGPPAA